VEKKIAEQVFSFIEPFAGYGFNRSHAACYAMIGYQTAYLKAHYPAEFMAALLTSDQDNIDRVAIEVEECRAMGIEVLAPHINESFEEFAVITGEDKKERIRFGLNAIKNVGRTVAREIVEERKKGGKFVSLADLVERVTTKDLNKKSLESLAKVGALEGLAERNQVLESMDTILNFAKSLQKMNDANQSSLFGNMELPKTEINLKSVTPAAKKQLLQWEKELLGLYVTDHPAAEYQEYLEKMATPIGALEHSLVGQKIKVGGVITKAQNVFLKNQNKSMFFVTIEDMKGKIELLVFPKILEKYEGIWKEDNVVIAEGRLSDKDGNFKLAVDTVSIVTPQQMENFKRIEATRTKNIRSGRPEPVEGPRDNISSEKKPETKKIFISLPASSNQETIKKLSGFFDQCELGSAKVYLEINGSRMETPYCVKDFAGFKEKLQELIPEGRINIY
jgi:DNA polymerase-3 subunit alpha